MEGQERRRMRMLGFIAAIAVLAAVALVLLVMALVAPLHTTREVALPLAVIAIVAGVVAWIGWRDEQEDRRTTAGREAAARERIDTEMRRAPDTGELEARIEELEHELAGTAGEHARLAARAVEAEERREREVAELEERRRSEVAELEQRLEREVAEAEERRKSEVAEAEQRREREVTQAREEHRREVAQLREEHQSELTRVREEHQREVEQERERHQRELSEERRTRARLESARQAEREWNRELRAQVVEMHQSRGLLGDTDDLRALVLHIAVTLLEAEKGLLLSRADSDGDGDLDFVCAEGFENDPRESALAQRFADEVIARDKIVREDGHEVDEETGTPADREIQNLVAIPIYIRDEFSGVVVCANREGGFHEHDDEVLLALGDQAGAVLDNGRLRGDLRSAYLSTVRLLAEAIEAKDPFLRGHSDEVSEYVAAVADKLGIERDRREELVFGSLLHDVGKIGISERILLKPAKLTDEEFAVVKLHPRIGFRLIDQVKALKPIADAVLHHHERWDGSGYPDGLKGEEIPLEARIICVADSFSAMTAERPYRRRMSLDDACAELERCAGSQFDPEVVRVFVEEVRCRPAPSDKHPLEEAMGDPVLQASRDPGEPLLGFGPLAVTDNLTLLYSHRYFHEIAERRAGGDEPFAVVLAELSEVAQLNHAEGYAAGDEAIRTAARAVQRTAVRCGGTACRYSGRRLGLIVPGADQGTAERIALELAGDLAEGPRASVGAAVSQDGDRGYDVIARARLALSPAGPVAVPPA